MASNKTLKGGLSKDAYAKLLAGTDDAPEQQEKPKEKTMAELMREQRQKERQHEQELREAAEKKAADEFAAREKEKEERELARQRALEAQMVALREEERRQEEAMVEAMRKTKRFYAYKLQEKGELRGQWVKTETGDEYFGDFAVLPVLTEKEKHNRLKHGAAAAAAAALSDYWVPHGAHGEYHDGENGETTHEGEWMNGLMHGPGRITFPNGDAWSGNFVLDEPHGLGLYVYAKDEEYGFEVTAPRLAIYHRGRHVCWEDELIPGTRVRLLDKKTHARAPAGVILGEGDKKGKYRVKLHHGVVKVLDLSMEPFELLSHGLPRLHTLEHFTRFDDAPQARYDFDADRAAPRTSDYQENFFHERVVTKADKKADAEKEKKEEALRKRWAEQRAKAAADESKAKEKAAEDGEVAAGLAEQAKEKAKQEAEKEAYEAKVRAAKEEMAANKAKQAELVAASRKGGGASMPEPP